MYTNIILSYYFLFFNTKLISLYFCLPLRLSRLVVIAVLDGLPERPRGGDQGVRRGAADEGAAEERAAGPGRQGGSRQQPQPQQRTLGQGRVRMCGKVWQHLIHSNLWTFISS